MNTLELMQARLALLQPVKLEIIDESAKHARHAGAKSGGGNYKVIIVADRFNGLSTLARHRLVHDMLGELMHGPIHALSLVARGSQETDL